MLGGDVDWEGRSVLKRDEDIGELRREAPKAYKAYGRRRIDAKEGEGEGGGE